MGTGGPPVCAQVDAARERSHQPVPKEPVEFWERVGEGLAELGFRDAA